MSAIKRILQYLSLTITLVLLPLSSAHALLIDFKLSQTEIVAGDIFTIDVIANEVFKGQDSLEELLAFGFDVSISDTSIVNYLGALVSASFENDSGLFPDTDIAGSSFPGISPIDIVDDSILLATLSFEALMKGEPFIGIKSDLNDFQGLFFFRNDPADITSSIRISIITEPTSIALMLIGIAGLGAYRLRRLSIVNLRRYQSN